MDPIEQNRMVVEISRAFSPGAPINTQDLFAGRIEQLNMVLTSIGSRGRHVIIFGERGVGKTSLARIVADIAKTANIQGLRSGTINCSAEDTFSSIWRKVFRDIVVTRTTTRPDFQSDPEQTPVDLGAWFESLASGDAIGPSQSVRSMTPDDVRQALSSLGQRVVIIDELDRVRDPEFSSKMADTLKALSDHSVDTTVILVGVADSVDQLIAEHASVERSLSQVHMPRMSRAELTDILAKAYSTVTMSIDDDAAARIAALSRGLPHFTHLLGQQAGIHAVRAGRTVVTLEDVIGALGPAIRGTSQSIQRSYHDATFSPRQNTHHAAVLLACALAPTDDLGFFAASDIKAPLSSIMKRTMDIPAFAKHLNDLSSDVRGPVLQKVGTSRRFRYRFINPLVQPYVILKGVEDGIVSDALLAGSEIARPR